jgi:arabinose-5-phosphate isomerase
MLQSSLTDRALGVLVEDAQASSLVAERMRPLHELPVVAPGTPLLDALTSMTTKGIGTAAVVVEDRVVGVVTDGDVRRALSEQAEASRMVVEAVMTAAPKVVEPDDTVERALALITEHRISELIVVGPMRRAVGLLSLHDIMTVPEAS